MRITSVLSIPTPSSTLAWLRALSDTLTTSWNGLAKILNGHVGFGDGVNSDNIDGMWLSTKTPAIANTDFTLAHNLGRVPVGYFLVAADKATSIYTGSVAATKTQITLREPVGAVNITIFVV